MMFVERTILVTTFPLPGILRWFPVTSTQTVVVLLFFSHLFSCIIIIIIAVIIVIISVIFITFGQLAKTCMPECIEILKNEKNDKKMKKMMTVVKVLWSDTAFPNNAGRHLLWCQMPAILFDLII